MRHGTLLLLFFSLCTGCGDFDSCSFYGLPTSPATSCPADNSGGGGGGPPPVPTLRFSVQPSSATEGAAITPTIQVRFLDATGNLVSGATDPITIGIANNPGGGTLSGATSVAAANGVATFPNLSIDKQGEAYALTAAATGFAPAVSFFFNVACTCWSSRPPMPTPRSGLGVGVVNGVVYAIGGGRDTLAFPFDYYNELATVQAYDPVTSNWTTKAPMPTSRGALGIGVANGVVYAVGGFDYGYNSFDLSPTYYSLGTVEAYDPGTNSWTAKAPMPTPRGDLGVGVVNGVLYAVGGTGSAAVLPTVEAYDPVENTWTSKAPMPTPRSGVAVGVVNGVLYAVGGQNPSGSLTTAEAYDPATDTWTAKEPMPTARGNLGVGVVNGVLYAVGGYTLYGSLGVRGTVERYDPVANSWTGTGPMLTSLFSFGLAVVNGVLYAAGGRYLGTLEAYDPAQDR